jgi:hypothetical protein
MSGMRGATPMQKPFIVARGGSGPAISGEEAETTDRRQLHAHSDVLARHGASVLDPDATAAEGWPEPQSTVYRGQTLLLPPDLHAEPALQALNDVLAPAGMRLVSAAPPGAAASVDPAPHLPHTAVLVPRAEEAGVDAWHALTLLRRAAGTAGAPLAREDVSRITLEHVLVGAAITGEPIVYSGSVPGGEPIVYSGGAGGEPIVYSGSLGSYLYGGSSARVPVEVCMDAPARRPAAECARRYGRRPVIAVLDSGVRAHPWLDVEAGSAYPDAGSGDGFATSDDGFVQVAQDMQAAIHAHSSHVKASGDRERQVIRFPWDMQAPTDLLVKALDSHVGHGTFIAGIIRQIVPDATVLSIRIMHSDGIVYEGDLVYALRLLAERVAAAHRENDPALMIDAVSLSLGYFTESAADMAYSSGLRHVIDTLRGQGVVVAAAAGNYGTRRMFYPAAFAGQPPAAGEVPLLSVGALNPNGSRAAFSDGGSWVSAWAPGAGMISAFPRDVNGDAAASVEVPGRSLSDTIASLDADDYRSGFAIWSGTSFAAPALAAHAVRAMLEQVPAGPADSALRLSSPGAQAAISRANQALGQLQRLA